MIMGGYVLNPGVIVDKVAITLINEEVWTLQ